MTVVHFQRRAQAGQFSLERMFGEIRRVLATEVPIRVQTSRFRSRGLCRRVYNICAAAFQQGDVNHVTGDVHFLTYFLRYKRTVLTILDCESLERFVGLKQIVFRFFWYTLPVRCSRVVTVISEATKVSLLRQIDCPPGKIEVIPCCVPREFKRDSRVFRQVEPRLLHIGTARNKNLLRVVEALSGLKCSLHIIGRLSKTQRSALERSEIRFSNSDSVTEAGIIEAYRECDILIYASTHEGFGMPIVEANMVGRPVVTGNVSSMPEVAGDAACLVDPFDPASIRAGIMRVIGDEGFRNDLIDRGYMNAQRFSPSVVAAKYLELYQRIANR